MEQLDPQQLRALRLSALARENDEVNAILDAIIQAPDALIRQLMDVHGWAAHEALCAVEQLQREMLEDTIQNSANVQPSTELHAVWALGHQWTQPDAWVTPEELSPAPMARFLRLIQASRKADLAASAAVVLACFAALVLWGIANTYPTL